MLSLSKQLFIQFDPEKRIYYFKISLILITSLFVTTDAYTPFAIELIRHQFNPDYPLTSNHILAAKLFILALTPIALWKMDSLFTKLFSLASFAYLAFYHFNLTPYIPQRYNYMAHLFIFQSIYFIPLKTQSRKEFALVLIQVYILGMYLQACLAKIIDTNWAWFFKEDILQHYILMLGSRLGRILIEHQFVAYYLGAITFTFELLGFFIFLRSKPMYGVIAITFHCCTWLIIGISFWHLFPLYIPIFLMDYQSKALKK